MHIRKKENLSQTVSRGIKVISRVFLKLRPDYVVLLGDRYEIFSAASAAFFLNIPIIHIHGGEKTSGSMDENIRHSITKMSTFHFVATTEYKKRVEQLGEESRKVQNVGGLGVDYIQNIKLLNKKQLCKMLDINLNKNNVLVTVHPDTVNEALTSTLIINTLKALNTLEDTNIFFTEPNADPGRNIILHSVQDFVRKDNQKRFLFKSLGIKNYLSLVNQVDLVVGNSSSGLLEVPSFKVPSLNIGNRQEGRLKSLSVFDVGTEFHEIKKKLNDLIYRSQEIKINYQKNPYGNGGASKKILKFIEKLDGSKSPKNSFVDL